jgi:3-methyladenine DNA glycosylase AlkD
MQKRNKDSLQEDIRAQLIEQADLKYQAFSSRLLPSISNILGVRLPHLRKIALKISKDDWRGYLQAAPNEYYEEVMLQGMLIGYAKVDFDEVLAYISAFTPQIDNWAICDSFCAGLKITKQNKEGMYLFLQDYLASDKEFDLRFAAVMLLNYYVEEEYIEKVLIHLDMIKHEAYYVKMAVAWAIATCYTKHPEPTLRYLRANTLDDFTYNKALQKIVESLQIDSETKELIRGLRRKRASTQ